MLMKTPAAAKAKADKPKTVTDVKLSVNILDSELISPIFQYQATVEYLIKDLISKGLSRAERLIIILYYYEEMTMKEIGATLNLSESRVSQMHSSILARLKSQLLHRTKDLEEVGE